MHVLERNKEYLWYANPTGETYQTDDNGYKTGEKTISYSEPTRVRMSMAISSGANNLGSQGMAELERYGITTGYTHRAVTEDMSCPMTEESLVWYRIEPTRVETRERIINGVRQEVQTLVPTPHNFKVVRKAQSLNHLIYYLKEVDVS